LTNLTIKILDFNGSDYLLPQFLSNFGDNPITKSLIDSSISISYNVSNYSTSVTFANNNSTIQNIYGKSTFVLNGLYSSYVVNGNNTVSLVPLPPTYTLQAIDSFVNEVTSAYFSLKTTNLSPGSKVDYTVSGLQSTEVNAQNLSGTVTLDESGNATIVVSVLADGIQEKSSVKLIVSVQGQSASIPVLDDSNQIGSNGGYQTKVIGLNYNSINTNQQNQDNLTFTFDGTPELFSAWTNSSSGYRAQLATLINFNGKFDFIDVGHTYAFGDYFLQPQNFVSGPGVK